MNDGGPAFPIPETENFFRYEGMSLRDYFAAKASTGLLAHSCDNDLKSAVASDIAGRSYEVADAMLAEREKKA